MECESQGDEDKILSVIEYLEMIRPYLSDMINDHETYGEWKIQLTMEIDFISSKDSDEIRTVHTKSHNTEIIMGNKTDEIIAELFKSLLQNYQKNLEKSTRGSEIVFDSVDLLYYQLQKISLKRGGSNVYSPKCLKNKKSTIDPKSNYDNSFQYTVTVALSYQNINIHPEKISKIKPFIDQYVVSRSLLMFYFYQTILNK